MLLYFVHIPKTAGSSLRQIFSQNFDSTEQLELPGGQDNKIIINQNSPRIIDNTIKLVTGHGYFGDLSHITSNVRHLTFLRRPADRFQSEINFLARKKMGGQILKVIEKHSCDPLPIASEIAASRDSRLLYLDNISIRHICGNIPLDRRVNENDLEDAKHKIINSFDSFYITEYFAQSVLIMAKRYGFRPPVFVPVNASAGKKRSENLDANTTDILRFDEMLYTFCRDKFRDTMPRSTSFDDAVDELTELSVSLSELNKEWVYKEYPVGMEPIVNPDAHASELQKVALFLSST